MANPTACATNVARQYTICTVALPSEGKKVCVIPSGISKQIFASRDGKFWKEGYVTAVGHDVSIHTIKSNDWWSYVD